ncbi:carboxypeptidase-like regulatory domain-containing protein [Aquimarina sp. ERC-38]|uniref:carboxypeptidase-like regulatory domain-containing protein n=1 Tax=Aquimarina sp. ERC-38 TaxID=2949996 RepID=UPI002246FF1C|nr:carboxypeptidase-like regulatory domain-containing protein [Aquimarina sp. ERC-38]UZO80799.1 carboxypeptidase-like regulatory domain-containing protein [Aquimarina sp. ERC-38]
MKTKLLLLLFLVTVGCVIAQEKDITITGKINAPVGDDVEGIVIYNKSLNQATITNKKGEFEINAALDNKIEITAMQYQTFTVVVDKSIIDTKKMTVYLNESVNLLDEVVVTPYDLSGNVKADVSRVAVNYGNLANVEEQASAPINDVDYRWTPDELSTAETNIPFGIRMKYGLNFINLFKAAFGSKKNKKTIENVDVAVKRMYDDRFFKENLNLELTQIDDFMDYAEQKGLNASYLKKGKELDLIEFLIVQSEAYKDHIKK